MRWHTDLLDGYVSTDLALPDAPRMRASPRTSSSSRPWCAATSPGGRGRAVLYVHGWNDYFFQIHLSDFWADRGFDFYALDLRRYGRSLRRGQLPGFISDLDEYDAELTRRST